MLRKTCPWCASTITLGTFKPVPCPPELQAQFSRRTLSGCPKCERPVLLKPPFNLWGVIMLGAMLFYFAAHFVPGLPDWAAPTALLIGAVCLAINLREAKLEKVGS